jgi:acyl-CoA synthetase (AMP-forming)/AMP-acid ligase II/thioesterase domain-containing protein/acyl carrier protein
MLNLCDEILRIAQLNKRNHSIAGSGLNPVSYEMLSEHVNYLSQSLSEFGIRGGDIVPVVLSGSAEAIIVLLSVLKITVCAPMNPDFQEADFESSILKLNARAIIVEDNNNTLIQTIALKLGIPTIKLLIKKIDSNIQLSFSFPKEKLIRQDARINPETALLLFTSATTGNTKLVPLTHNQIISMVSSMRSAFPAADNGRVLIITPHFHLHCLLSMLIQFFSGGTIISTSGFDSNQFINWIRDFHPTQFTANPTIFRAILSLGIKHNLLENFKAFRFVTCAGSLLTDQLRDEIELTLGVPVIEGYGLTESGRVTMTPLNPAYRKPNSVGRICGSQVTISDTVNCAALPIGEIGEILLKGDSVIQSYYDDEEANILSFTNGWFRTGDLGRLDEDGFLFLVGRIKEMINRGAEKILPYEIEEIICRNQAVNEAVVFGYPHPRLGEDIGVCIVLKLPLKAPELRKFLSQYLAPYKIPRLIIFLDEIPKGPTGKPQRSNMANILSINPRFDKLEYNNSESLDLFEEKIAKVWSELLNIEYIGKNEDFYLLGGDSLLAVQMLTIVEQEFGFKIETDILARTTSLSDFANAIKEIQNNTDIENYIKNKEPNIVTLQPLGNNPPLFLFHLLNNNIIFYKDLIKHLGNSNPIFGLRLSEKIDSKSQKNKIELIAKKHVESIKKVQSKGPYFLGGYSSGGVSAYETARQLVKQGDEIGMIILIDTYCSKPFPRFWTEFKFNLKNINEQFATLSFKSYVVLLINCLKPIIHNHFNKFKIQFMDNLKFIFDFIQIVGNKLNLRSFRNIDEESEFNEKNWEIESIKLKLKPLYELTLLLWCHLDDSLEWRVRMKKKWQKLTGNKIIVKEIPGNHINIIKEPQVQQAAFEIKIIMNKFSKK